MQLKRATFIVVCCGVALALAGCGNDIRRSLGLNQQAPDEFRVVSRAPLSVPPSFALKPPRAGAQRPQEQTPQEQARQAVFRAEGGEQAAALPDTSDASLAERNLLRQTGADEANPDIRQIVDRESQDLAAESRDFIDMLIFWNEPEAKDDVVDAEAEARRLRGAEAMGERPSGEVPVIERTSPSLFDRLF